jgi:hypothetical protein
LDYLQNKLKQAEADVGLFTVLIDEVTKLQNNNKQLDVKNNFLKVVHNKENSNKSTS